LWLENRQYCRYFEEHHIRPSFQPHEKQAVHTFFTFARNPSRFFTLVSPKTILTRWKNALARYWSHKRHTPGRSPLTKATKELILQLKKENFLWGSRCIRDELRKLSIDVSHETISKLLRHYRKTGDIKPTLSWKRFISSHINSLFACDFFTTMTFSMVTMYIFFIMELKTRRIVQYGITTNPTIQFLRNQFSEFSYNYPDSTLIHDNSGELRWFPYEQYSIKGVNIVPYSPNMNAYAERFVGSVHRDCLDYFIIFTHGQLRRIVKAYIDYYNNYRPHQGIHGIPNGPPEQGPKDGIIKKKPLLFELHNHYYREAA
jgi:transposase InsO family protein